MSNLYSFIYCSVFFFFSVGSFAQFTEQQRITTYIDQLTSIKCVDLDQDNDFDIIMASDTNNRIIWLENDGGGTLGHPQIIDNHAMGVIDIGVTDIDQDGDLDIVAALEENRSIECYFNNGSGQFDEKKTIATDCIDIRRIHLADLDQDDAIDIVATYDSQLFWFKNQEIAFFSSAIYITDVGRIDAIQTADLDKDGDLDLMYAEGYGDNWVSLENTQYTQFDSLQTFNVDYNHSRGFIELADLDEDGFEDLIRIDYPNIVWARNDQNGNFEENATFIRRVDSYLDIPNSLKAMDVDQDGDLDIVWVSRNAFRWIENMGNGVFEIVHSRETAITSTIAMLLRDFDNDGRTDLVIGGSTGIASWFKNEGLGKFDKRHFINTAVQYAQMKLGDIDSDGDLDLVTFDNTKLGWFENNGKGNFGVFQLISYYDRKDFEVQRGFDLADINQDGRLDIAFAYENNTLAWFAQQANGNFERHNVNIPKPEPHKIALEDVDGDNDIDMIVVHRYDGMVWYENQGNHHFSEKTHFIKPYTDFHDLQIADLNNDGKLDLIPYGSAWYERGENGNFSIEHFIEREDPGLIYRYLVTDLNQDGLTDILFAQNYSDYKFGWFKNKGNGIFEQYLIDGTLTLNDVNDLFVGDIEGDGDLDIFMALRNTTDNLAWYENDGNNHFGNRKSISTPYPGAVGIKALDINQDDKMDIIGAVNDDRIILYQNEMIVNSITTHEPQLYLNIYPNPSKDHWHIHLQYPTNQNYQLKLLDVTGKLLQSYTDLQNGTNLIERKGLQSGVYFLQLEGETGTVLGMGKLLVK